MAPAKFSDVSGKIGDIDSVPPDERMRELIPKNACLDAQSLDGGSER
jgi:hypothetical protein